MVALFSRHTAPDQRPPSRDDLERAVRRHGVHSASYVLLEGRKRYFSSPRVDGFVAYQSHGGMRVIAGDPVCDAGDAATLLHDLGAGGLLRRACAVSVREEMLGAFAQGGFDHVCIGREAVFDLPNFTLAGGALASVRAACNKARREGVRVTEHDPHAAGAAALNQQFRDISRQWLREKSGREDGFLLGGLALEQTTAKRYFIALGAGGRVEGFIVCEPIFARHGWYLDVTRRRSDAVRGTMELLTTEIFTQLAGEGFAIASLGLAPLGALDDTDARRHPHFSWFARFARAHLTRPIDFKGLERYKRKYDPHWWEPRFLCFRPCLGPRLLYATLAARRQRAA